MNDMTVYDPRPIKTDHIQLAPELQQLVERLSENSHDVWAMQRIRDGWTYGDKRDDREKKHPDLVPYANLTESEKEYDRATVESTLKAIVSLGYSIVVGDAGRSTNA